MVELAWVSCTAVVGIDGTLLHDVKNGRENVRQPNDADDAAGPGDQQGLLVAEHQLVNGLVQAGLFCDEFPLGGPVHVVGDADMAGFLQMSCNGDSQRW